MDYGSIGRARQVYLGRLSPRAKRAQSDWRATVTLGCPIYMLQVRYLNCVLWASDFQLHVT
jgi:hypothetical protein